MQGRGLQGVVGLTMFLFLSNYVSRKVGPSYVRAFSSGTSSLARRSRTSSYGKTCRSGSQMVSFLFDDSKSDRGMCYSTTTTSLRSAVEQDLDSALDDLLQGTFDDIEEVEVEPEVAVSKPTESVSIISVMCLFIRQHGHVVDK